MVSAAKESDRLIELFVRAEAVYLDEPGAIAFVGVFFFGLFEVRREDRVDHVELVLENAVLFLQLPDSLEKFLFSRHDPIVHPRIFFMKSANHAKPDNTDTVEPVYAAASQQFGGIAISALRSLVDAGLNPILLTLRETRTCGYQPRLSLEPEQTRLVAACPQVTIQQSE
jgi:hypothetical protein